ncbi:DegT/DnrJ/EryC1/StrS family aminotransferase [Acidobacteria bacterium AH-259-A15]|nr:DegT/DnrJ/EryC1/StrS family aminotransferase [Acidobacteria bacterium AH-259-A15]
MSSPDITAVEIEAVKQVLQTPCLSIGPRIAEFEDHFSAYIGTSYAIGVSSGTAGLHLAVMASGVGEGDLVITTPFSFVAGCPASSALSAGKWRRREFAISGGRF